MLSLLNNETRGQGVLSAYRIRNVLSRVDQTILCDVICESWFSYLGDYPEYVVTSADYSHAASEIVKCFPTEDKVMI